MTTAKLYVQIPAYRDRELLPTLTDLWATAAHPDQLRVAVAWQYGDDEAYLTSAFRRWPGLEILAIPAAESRGCNWARSLLQQQWAGEPYTLFLDSHHRFVPGWDATAVQMYEDLRACGYERPLLTAYLPPYDPARDPQGRADQILRMRPLERIDGLLFRLTSDPYPDGGQRTSPYPAALVSLHFLFAAGRFNEDVPFDPTIYFFADEVAIALRAFTHGYDPFCPHRILGWHLYDRATRVTHWADHADWEERNARSLARLRELYTGDVRGMYGTGAARSIDAYEERLGTRLIETTP